LSNLSDDHYGSGAGSDSLPSSPRERAEDEERQIASKRYDRCTIR
jgi:hypothetical protein